MVDLILLKLYAYVVLQTRLGHKQLMSFKYIVCNIEILNFEYVIEVFHVKILFDIVGGQSKIYEV